MIRMLDNDPSGRTIQFPGLAGESGIIHFVTTRRGGVSSGNYSSFNVGEYCGDTPECVAENRRLLCDAFQIQPRQLFVPHQMHGDRILVIDKAFLSHADKQQRKALQGVDALVTNETGACIAVSTADCVPLLLYVPEKKVVAAVHAGWRGTVQRIVQQTVCLMQEQFACVPKKIRAAIGPAIGADAFEVGEEVVEAFASVGMDMEKIMKRNAGTGKAHIDLWLANRLQLLEAGLADKHIEVAGICTYTEHERFFSARRLGIESGRMLSGIMIKEHDTY